MGKAREGSPGEGYLNIVRSLAASSLLLASCATTGAAPAAPRAVPLGRWASDKAVLTVTATGADLELVCARARAAVPLPLDGKGAFDIEGTYLQGSGAPPPAPPQAQKVRFTGTATGSTLQLGVAFPDGRRLGPWTLTLGSPAQVPACLAAPRPGREQ